MNLRRLSTSSPIRVEKMGSDSAKSLIVDLQQCSAFGVHGRLPKLGGVHFAEALVAGDGNFARPFALDVIEQLTPSREAPRAAPPSPP